VAPAAADACGRALRCHRRHFARTWHFNTLRRLRRCAGLAPVTGDNICKTHCSARCAHRTPAYAPQVSGLRFHQHAAFPQFGRTPVDAVWSRESSSSPKVRDRSHLRISLSGECPNMLLRALSVRLVFANPCRHCVPGAVAPMRAGGRDAPVARRPMCTIFRGDIRGHGVYALASRSCPACSLSRPQQRHCGTCPRTAHRRSLVAGNLV
jgi:hypothetical protein